MKALRQELNLPVAAMLDTKGPEVRLKNFAGGSVTLQEGQEFTLTVEDVRVTPPAAPSPTRAAAGRQGGGTPSC